MILKERIAQFLEIDEEALGIDRYTSAIEINSRFGNRGEVYWVGEVGQSLGMGVAIIGHCYLIPQGAKDSHIASNHADDGYDEFPALTIEEVINVGRGYRLKARSD